MDSTVALGLGGLLVSVATFFAGAHLQSRRDERAHRVRVHEKYLEWNHDALRDIASLVAESQAVLRESELSRRGVGHDLIWHGKQMISVAVELTDSLTRYTVGIYANGIMAASRVPDSEWPDERERLLNEGVRVLHMLGRAHSKLKSARDPDSLPEQLGESDR